MSYTSTSTLGQSAVYSHVKSIIVLMGYKKYQSEFSNGEAEHFFWAEGINYESYVGVELSLYKNNDSILVDTRTRAGRSFYDLDMQNKTIKLLRNIFGGKFSTDFGTNTYFVQDETRATHMESGLYLARWIYHNAMIKPTIYLDCRMMTGEISKPDPTGFTFIDSLNPRFFSNNMIVPYIVGVWESYMKSSFIVLLKYHQNRDRIFKNARLSVDQMKDISSGKSTVEEAIGEAYSFQRPKVVVDNFRAIDDKLDLCSVLRKPYRNRKKTLYDTIEHIVDLRNKIVHTGYIDNKISDAIIKQTIVDMEAAVDRVYTRFGECYDFVPNRNY